MHKFIKTSIESYLNEHTSSGTDVWYHGTNKKFDKFDLSNFGNTDSGWWGVGVYFHSDIETAKVYGSIIKKVTFNTDKILNLPVNYSGKYLFDKLRDLGLDVPLEYEKYSANKIIRSIGKHEFTDFIKKYFDVMVINYIQGSKEAVVFNLNVIDYL